MPKNSLQKRPTKRQRKLRGHINSGRIIGLVISLCLFGIVFARWRRNSFVPPHPSPILQPSPTPALSKEYIYAGGRLVAIEEPGSPVSAPTSLVAATISNTQVNITWAAPVGVIDHYQLERSASINGPYTQLSPNPVTNSFNDTTVTSGVAYLYRVCAVDAAGNRSTYSNIDLATAVSFTDDPLITGTTRIKAQHLVELRQAVSAVLSAAALSSASWTDPVPSGVQIRRNHIQELRTNLDQARSALGLTAISYVDPTLTAGTAGIKKAHVDELRQGVK